MPDLGRDILVGSATIAGLLMLLRAIPPFVAAVQGRKENGRQQMGAKTTCEAPRLIELHDRHVSDISSGIVEQFRDLQVQNKLIANTLEGLLDRMDRNHAEVLRELSRAQRRPVA